LCRFIEKRPFFLLPFLLALGLSLFYLFLSLSSRIWLYFLLPSSSSSLSSSSSFTLSRRASNNSLSLLAVTRVLIYMLKKGIFRKRIESLLVPSLSPSLLSSRPLFFTKTSPLDFPQRKLARAILSHSPPLPIHLSHPLF